MLSEGHIDDIIGSLKHEGFKEENEVRLFFKKIPNHLVKYRGNKDNGTPYIEIGDSKFKLPIEAIYISPKILINNNFNEIKNEIDQLLEQGGYSNNEVSIIPSDIPLRY